MIDRSSDRRRQFAIDETGTVSIQRRLDRETSPSHQIKILAIDDGDPAKTATATLTVIVEDINDNAPRYVVFGTITCAYLILPCKLKRK